MFYVAYVADPKRDVASRPVTFAFNGGPGSSDAMLHLLALGPLRAGLSWPAAPDHGDNAPLVLKENEETLLDRTDLVFIDAVSTGYSHAIAKSKDSDFWGVDEDAESFSRAIQQWLNINHRWNSPVAILGESYGGTRAAVLASLLPGEAVRLGGVILVSPGLMMSSLDWYSDAYFADFLPSYAAVAWYYNRVTPKPSSLEALAAEARAYALGPYLTALAQGRDLPSADRSAVAKQMAHLTGLDEGYLVRNNLRVNPLQFGKELLRSRGLTIGPLDGRQQGIDVDPNGPPADVDALSMYLSAHLGPLVKDYLTRELGYRTERLYRYNNPSVQDPWIWKRKVRDEYPWSVRPSGYDLASAVNQHPNIKVLVLSGYYDLVAPFVGTEQALAHLPVVPELASNFTIQYYPSGHMVYIDDESRRKMKHDLDTFYDATFGPARP
jgi:carboxypeptidase C (cathepsin A)